jgi:heme-binding NEAT domain protein
MSDIPRKKIEISKIKKKILKMKSTNSKIIGQTLTYEYVDFKTVVNYRVILETQKKSLTIKLQNSETSLWCLKN